MIIQSVLRPADIRKRINALDADEILRAISANLVLPTNLALPIFVGTQDYPGQRVRVVYAWPQFTGRIRFRLESGGRFRDIAPSVRSMTPELERALLKAVEATAKSPVLGSMQIPKEGFVLDYEIAAEELLSDSLALALRKTTFPAYKVDSMVRFFPGNPLPRYPESVRLRYAEGETTFGFVVGESGAIVPGTAILLATTYKELVDPIVDVLPKYRFLPAVAMGCPVNTWVRQKFEFKLDR